MFLIQQLVDFSLVIFKGNFHPFCMISAELAYDLLLLSRGFDFLS